MPSGNGKKHKSVGSVVRFDSVMGGSLVGVVKWFGVLPGVGKMVGILCPERIPRAVLEKFVQQAKGGEKADGTYGGEKYLKGKKNDRFLFQFRK